jgi:hypothetical protein
VIPVGSLLIFAVAVLFSHWIAAGTKLVASRARRSPLPGSLLKTVTRCPTSIPSRLNTPAGREPLRHITSEDFLLCPAWRKHGTARTVKQDTVILHSRADDVVPFADNEELVRNSGLPASALIEVGDDHRLADPEPLRKMLEACQGAARGPTP